MATESTILVPTTNINFFDRKDLDPDSAIKVSEVLQDNHEIHHVFSNSIGHHNHILHHLTTLLALGAESSTIKSHYQRNKSYQAPKIPPSTPLIPPSSFKDNKVFMQHISDPTQYPSYLEFFRQEIREQGYQDIVMRYLFQGDDLADDMLQGFMQFHPVIHLSCALELHQPALIAEALALTAVHTKRLSNFYLPAEHLATSLNRPRDKTLVSILGEAKNDKRIQATQSWEEPFKYTNGPVQKARDAVFEYAAQWNVSPTEEEEVEEKMAEIFNVAAFAAAAAQLPPKVIKLDFFLIHGITASHALSVLLSQTSIPLPLRSKARLLEWMGRHELATYLNLGAPSLYIDEIRNYKTKEPFDGDGWKRLVERAVLVDDDGHAAKTVRGLMHGQRLCERWEGGREKFLVQGDMWLRIGHMCLDSVERSEKDVGGAVNGQDRWIRFCGFPEAWEKFPDRTVDGVAKWH